MERNDVKIENLAEKIVLVVLQTLVPLLRKQERKRRRWDEIRQTLTPEEYRKYFEEDLREQIFLSDLVDLWDLSADEIFEKALGIFLERLQQLKDADLEAFRAKARNYLDYIEKNRENFKAELERKEEEKEKYDSYLDFVIERKITEKEKIISMWGKIARDIFWCTVKRIVALLNPVYAFFSGVGDVEAKANINKVISWLEEINTHIANYVFPEDITAETLKSWIDKLVNIAIASSEIALAYAGAHDRGMRVKEKIKEKIQKESQKYLGSTQGQNVDEATVKRIKERVLGSATNAIGKFLAAYQKFLEFSGKWDNPSSLEIVRLDPYKEGD